MISSYNSLLLYSPLCLPCLPTYRCKDVKPLTAWPNGCLNHLLMPSCARVVHKPYFVYMIYLVYSWIAIDTKFNESNGSWTQMNMHLFFCRDQSISHKHLYVYFHWCYTTHTMHVILFIFMEMYFMLIVSTMVFLWIQFVSSLLLWHLDCLIAFWVALLINITIEINCL